MTEDMHVRHSTMTVDGIESSRNSNDIDEHVYARDMIQLLDDTKYCSDYDQDSGTCLCYYRAYDKREWWNGYGVSFIEGSTWSDIMKAPQEALLNNELLCKIV